MINKISKRFEEEIYENLLELHQKICYAVYRNSRKLLDVTSL